jgi:tRNA(Arg) A34 adenosine deaminase TadA
MTDEHCMRMALDAAEEAFARGDWPVGAVLVNGGEVLSIGQNRQISQRDLLVHAETDAIRVAESRHGLARLAGGTLYATMEPCPMCAWAVKAAGIRRLVLGLRHATLRRTDLGRYRIESFCEMVGFGELEFTTGVLEAECLALRRRWGKDQVARD